MKWFVVTLACLFFNFGGTDVYATHPAESLRFVNQLETQPSSWKRDTTLIKLYYELGCDNLFKDAFLSVFYGQKALKLAQSRRWEKGKVLAYHVLSHYYYINGDFDILMELATESIKLATQQKMPNYEAEAYRLVAHGYSEYFKYDSAYSNYQKAITLVKQEKNDSLLAAYHESLGNYFRDRHKLPEAIDHYEKADSIFKALDSPLGIAFVTLNRGYIYIRSKEFSKAIDYFSRSLTLFDELDMDYGRMSAYNDLANGYFLQKKYPQAISSALKAKQIAGKFHSEKQMNWALMSLYRCYRDMGDIRGALRYMEELNYYRREDFDALMERRFSLFQLLYENERKDEAIRTSELAQQRNSQRFLVVLLLLVLLAALLLLRSNQQLRRKNKEIKDALVEGQTLERKRVASELHDTLGGTIAAINWYMYGINKASLPPAEQQIYDRLQVMITSAYEEIRTLSHNYLPKILEEEGLVQAIQRLVEKLNQSNQVKFELEINGMDERPDRQVEFELYSTVLELANNIFKHAEASHAFISLTGSRNRFTLTVSDNGHGFDETYKEGMGLLNVRNRVHSLGGNLVKSNDEDQGTRIEITIPRTKETFA